MSIGANIKRLRREQDITQEQLAEYLGITSRAISQWECGRTTPDISQIPALCHIFDVTSDTLLGIGIEKNNEEIYKYMDQSCDYEKQGDFKSSAAILREALRKFPKSHEIMMCLANASIYANQGNDSNAYEEAFTLCKRVLAESTKSFVRYETLIILGRAYERAGRREEMLKLAEEMPSMCFSREEFMRYRWKGDDGFENLRGYMSHLIGRVIEMLAIVTEYRHDDNSYRYSVEDRICLWKTRVSLLELLFPDRDYLFFAQYGDQACTRLCSAYLEKQDFEKAWYWVEKRADFIIHMETYDFTAPHTSPVLRDEVIGGWIVVGKRFSEKMLDWLTKDEESVALRSNPRYDHLVKRLKSVAAKQ